MFPFLTGQHPANEQPRSTKQSTTSLVTRPMLRVGCLENAGVRHRTLPSGFPPPLGIGPILSDRHGGSQTHLQVPSFVAEETAFTNRLRYMRQQTSRPVPQSHFGGAQLPICDDTVFSNAPAPTSVESMLIAHLKRPPQEQRLNALLHRCSV
jgi:hypothetical protein